MEERLYDATFEGNVRTFNQLIQEDPLILEKATSKFSDTTPLHIAARLGHIDFVRAILVASCDMCLARDKEGRNPLHLAAIKGKGEVLEVLIGARPLAAREKTDGGGTILHLCVKYRQLEALKMIVEKVKDPEFLNAKNDEGTTILHLAVLDDQSETVRCLVENNIEVNAKNANGKTALDILAGNTNSESGIETFIRNSGALTAEEITRSHTTGHTVPIKGSEWLDKKRDAIMVVASLIATMAFQAGLNPAGGVWQEDLPDDGNPAVSRPHIAGRAIMAYHHPKYYRYFVRANTIAFVSSLSTILLLISGLPFKRRLFLWFLMVIMWLTITSVALTYGISIMMVTPKDYRKTLSHVIKIAIIVWCGVMSLLLLGNTIRLIKRWIKAGGIKKLRSRSGNSAVQDQSNGRQVSVQIY